MFQPDSRFFLLRIVVELRSLRIRSLANPIDVGILVYSVAIQSLRDVGRIEDVRIISVAAFLSAILRSRLPECFHIVGETGIVMLILVCCSMCAWYVVRVNSKISNFFYYLFVFSMVVPFQMLMFTLSNLADRIGFNTPFNICFIYLGFGAGLAVFMFAGFVKNIPLEIEEAAMIDGCNPVQVFFKIVLPIMKPTYLSVGILETMWVWNDYLLPYLTLDSTKYKTIPILIQYFRGGYGHVELGPMMACIMMVVIPIVIMYIFCQKYIIDGVVAGAVKG